MSKSERERELIVYAITTLLGVLRMPDDGEMKRTVAADMKENNITEEDFEELLGKWSGF